MPTLVVRPDSPVYSIVFANAALLKVSNRRWEELKNESVVALFHLWSTPKDGDNAQKIEQLLAVCLRDKEEKKFTAHRAFSDTNLERVEAIQVVVYPMFQSDGAIEFLVVSFSSEIPYNFIEQGLSAFSSERTLFEFSLNPIVLIDFDRVIRDANASFFQFFQFPSTELGTRRLDDFLSIRHPRKSLDQILFSKDASPFFVESTTGLRKWVTFHSNTIHWQGNSFEAVTLIDQTMTQEKDDLLRFYSSRQRRTNEVVKVGYFEFDLQRNSSVWSDELYAIWEVDPTNFAITQERFLETIHPEDRPLLDAFYADLLRGNLQKELSFRIQTPSGIKHIRQHHESETDMVGNCVVYGVAQDITESRNLKAEVSLLEARYQQIFQLSPLPMWIFSLESYQFLDVNQAAIETYGFSRDEFLRLNLFDVHLSEDYSQVLDAIINEIKLQANGNYRNIRHVKRSGEVIQVELRSNQIQFQNQCAVLAVVKDISAEIASELALNRLNEKLLSSQQIADVGYWEYYSHTQSFTWTPHLYNVLEVHPAQFEPTFDSIRRFLLPEDHYLLSRTFLATLTVGTYQDMEHAMITGAGNTRWMLQRIRIREQSESGDFVVEGIIQDITDRRKRELELRQMNDRYRIAMKAAKEAIWDWNPSTDETVWSIGFSEVFGHELEDGRSTGDFWASLIHPNDRSRILERFAAIIEDHRQVSFEFEYLFLRSDGSYAAVFDRGFLIRNEKGQLERVIGSMMDISERQAHLQHIHEQNKRLKEIAWKQSHEVRAPLTKLISLVYLLKRRGSDVRLQNRKIEDEIIHSADELDKVIRSIVRKTEN